MQGKTARSRSQKKQSPKQKPRTTTDVYAVVGAGSNVFTYGSTVDLPIPAGPTKNFIIDYISALVNFENNLVQDPVFLLDFRTGGVDGEHVFSPSRIGTSAANPKRYQLYTISRRVVIAVDAGKGVTFKCDFMPPDVNASLSIYLSGHFA